MEIIDMIKNDTKDSKWIIEQYKNDLLFVDNSFQRRYVWQEKHKIKLIETILLGYAIPEIYLWDVSTDPESGDTKRSIVDGQQRIGALVSFINNDFKLKSKFLDEKNCSYADKFFSQLSPEDKSKIWKYRFSFRIVMDEVVREDIVKLFLRLNSTDKSLNPQELRNAEFDGAFLKTAEHIADFEFWEKYKVFASDSIRRMGDIEFVSSILIFLRLGIASEITQAAINEAYDLFDEKYDEADEDISMVRDILNEIEKAIQLDECLIPFIRKSTHLYTIIVVVYKAISIQNKLNDNNIELLVNFYKNYESEEDCDRDAIEFKALMLEGSRSKQKRMRRSELLSKIIGV